MPTNLLSQIPGHHPQQWLMARRSIHFNPRQEPVAAQPIEVLSFKGGGVLGVAYSDVIRQLVEQKEFFKHINRIEGTSAGAITAALLALNHNPDEIHDFMSNLDFTEFLDTPSYSWSNVRAYMPASMRMLFNQGSGMYQGKRFHRWIQDRVTAKTGQSDLTFSQLHALAQKNPHEFKELAVTGFNLGTGSTEVFSATTTPHMKIADAVRISMSYPGVFEAFRHDNGYYYVDGGVSGVANDPQLHHDEQATLHIRVDDQDKIDQRHRGKAKQPPLAQGLFSRIKQVVGGFRDDEMLVDRRLLNTIAISNNGISATQFDISDADKQKLIEAGRVQGQQWLQHHLYRHKDVKLYPSVPNKWQHQSAHQGKQYGFGLTIVYHDLLSEYIRVNQTAKKNEPSTVARLKQLSTRMQAVAEEIQVIEQQFNLSFLTLAHRHESNLSAAKKLTHHQPMILNDEKQHPAPARDPSWPEPWKDLKAHVDQIKQSDSKHMDPFWQPDRLQAAEHGEKIPSTQVFKRSLRDVEQKIERLQSIRDSYREGLREVDVLQDKLANDLHIHHQFKSMIQQMTVYIQHDDELQDVLNVFKEQLQRLLPDDTQHPLWRLMLEHEKVLLSKQNNEQDLSTHFNHINQRVGQAIRKIAAHQEHLLTQKQSGQALLQDVTRDSTFFERRLTHIKRYPEAVRLHKELTILNQVLDQHAESKLSFWMEGLNSLVTGINQINGLWQGTPWIPDIIQTHRTQKKRRQIAQNLKRKLQQHQATIKTDPIQARRIREELQQEINSIDDQLLRQTMQEVLKRPDKSLAHLFDVIEQYPDRKSNQSIDLKSSPSWLSTPSSKALDPEHKNSPEEHKNRLDEESTGPSSNL